MFIVTATIIFAWMVCTLEGRSNHTITGHVCSMICCLCVGAIEHAAWTQGDRHLQTWRHDLNWFQMMSFDVILTALGLLFILGVVLLLVLRLIVRKLVPLLSQRMSASSVTAKKVK